MNDDDGYEVETDAFDLVEPDEGAAPDEEAAAVARAVGGAGAEDDTFLEREGVVPPEAAAMHIVAEDEL